MSSAVSGILPNPLSHKHDGSPHSLSTISSSPACGGNFSPNQALISQPNSGSAAATTNSNGNAYQVYGVSPTEGSTASGICSSNNGPMSNVENSLTGNIDHSSKMKDTDFYAPEDPMMQMSTNIPSTDTSVPSTSIITIKDPFDDDDDVKYNFPSHQQQHQLPPQMSLPHFEQIAFSRKPFYPITDRNLSLQMPYAFNRPLLPYPYPDGSILNRSHAYHPMPPMHHMMRMMHPMAMMQRMPNMMPPAPMPPPNPPAPPKPKATRRKQNNNQQQQQHQPPPTPQMLQQLHMVRTPMDMIRPSSSAMRPPDMALHQSMKMNGEMRLSPMVKKYGSQRVLDSGVCGGCNAHINRENQGVLCTALNQGCLKIFHARCESICDDALNVLAMNENIEWVCRACTHSKRLTWDIL